MKVRVLSFVGVLLVLFALAPVAHACSCFRGDPRDRLAESAGAFIGKLVSRDPAPAGSRSTTYHFSVDEAVKGDIGRTVDVQSSSDGASCGFEVAPGQQMGFFLERRDDEWHGGLCGQIEPDDLRKAAAPLPKPDGVGPLAFLVGGTYGDVRSIGLDADGRTLAYGKGSGITRRMSACPGSRFAAEVLWANEEPHGTYIAVRDLTTFESVRKTRLTEFGDPRKDTYPLLATAVACTSQNADDIVVFGANNEADHTEATGKILRVAPERRTVLWEGGLGGEAAFVSSDAKAYVATKTGKLVEVDLSSRAVRDVAKIDGVIESGVAISPSGRHVAVLTGQGLSVVEVRTGELRKTKDGHGGEVHWTSDDRLIVTGVGEGEGEPEVVVFDTSLSRVGAWKGWTAQRSIVHGDVLSGITHDGKLVRAPALTGPAKDVRTFDSPELNEIAAVPQVSAEPEPSDAPRPTSSPVPTPEPTAEATTASEPTPSAVALPEETTDDRTSRVPVGTAAVGSVVLASALALLATRRARV